MSPNRIPRSRLVWSEQRFPDPPCQVSLFHLSSLPNAPADFAPWGETWNVVRRARRLRRAELETLCDFHFWGIDPEFRAKHNVADIIKQLFKLFYFQADYHRPRKWDDMLDFRKDAGPRLINPIHLTPGTVHPVSRWYPHTPANLTIIDAGYRRPESVNPDWKDVQLEQFLISSHVMPPGLELNGGGREPSVEIDTRQTKNIINRPTRGRRKHEGNTITITDDDGDIEILSAPQVDVPANSNRPTDTTVPQLVSSSTNLLNVLPQDRVRKVVETVERALIGIPYADLDRHPSAIPQNQPPRPFIATETRNLIKAIIGSFPATSHVRVVQTGQSIRLSPDGHPYPFRGRGPVNPDKSPNSALLDCVILVGKLLDAGSTHADRKRPGWHSQLTPVERAFIELTDVDWDLCGPAEGVKLKDTFCEMLAILFANEYEETPGISVHGLWDVVADNFAQFLTTFTEEEGVCQCSPNEQASRGTYDCHYVEPFSKAEDQTGVTMQALLTRTFEPYQSMECKHCAQPDTTPYHRTFSRLPLRLVLRLRHGIQLYNHTQTITFRYQDGQQVIKTATYRWLGGVYTDGNNYRVFWTDTQRGEPDTGEFCMYDATENEGMIVGGIAPVHPDDRVPESWVRPYAPPLLFYERVINPSEAVLRLAARTTSDMLESTKNDRVILNEHTPWSVPPMPSADGYPWQQNLPTTSTLRFQNWEEPYVAKGAPIGGGNNNPVVRSKPPLFNRFSVSTTALDPEAFPGAAGGQPPTFATYLPPLPSVGPSGFSPSAWGIPGGDIIPDGNIQADNTHAGSPSGLSHKVFESLGFGTPRGSPSRLLLTQPMDTPKVYGDSMQWIADEEAAQTFRLTPILEDPFLGIPSAGALAAPMNTGGYDLGLSLDGMDYTGAGNMNPSIEFDPSQIVGGDLGPSQDDIFAQFMETMDSCRGRPQPRPIVLITKGGRVQKRVIEEVGSDDESEEEGKEQKVMKKRMKNNPQSKKEPNRVVTAVKKSRAQKLSLRKQTLQREAFKKMVGR